MEVLWLISRPDNSSARFVPDFSALQGTEDGCNANGAKHNLSGNQTRAGLQVQHTIAFGRAKKRGEPKLPPLSVRPCSRSLVALVFAQDARPIQRDNVELNGEVALGKVGSRGVADEGEPMAPFEVGRGDDVALESGHGVRRKIQSGGAGGIHQRGAVARHYTATVEQREYQFAARRDDAGQRACTRGCDRRRCGIVRRHSTKEEECHLARLEGRAKWVSRSVGDCDTRVESALVGYEREQQVAGALIDRTRVARARLVAEARNRSVGVRSLDAGQRSARG